MQKHMHIIHLNNLIFILWNRFLILVCLFRTSEGRSRTSPTSYCRNLELIVLSLLVSFHSVMENLYWYLIIVLSPVFLGLAKQFFFKKIKKSPPSPHALPIIGHLHLIKNDLYEDLTSLSYTYGPIFSLRFGRRSFVVVSSPSTIEECFTKNDIILANRPQSMAGDRLTYNYVSIGMAPYGHIWRVLRRLAVIETLSVRSLQKSSVIREEEIQMIIRSLFRELKNGSRRINLNHWISVYTLNVMMRMLAGRCSIREEDAGEEFGKKVIEESKNILGSSMILNSCDFFPVLRWIGYKGLEKRMFSLQKKRDEFLQGLIDELRQVKSILLTSRNGMDKKKKVTLIENLLTHQEQEPDFLSDDIVKSMVSVMFIAGRETSILTIEWAMSLLLNHPNAMQKLRAEIDNVVGHERLLAESDIPKLPYLRCIINETLRLYPAAPLLIPHCASQNCRIQGYDIPKGTIILANVWAVHRDPKLWEQPEKFMPERFEAQQSGEKEEINFKFLPFGAGRRACPGSNLGIRNVSLAVGALIQCFQWEKVEEEDGDMDISFNNKITLRKAKPLQGMCFPREELNQLLPQLIRSSLS